MSLTNIIDYVLQINYLLEDHIMVEKYISLALGYMYKGCRPISLQRCTCNSMCQRSFFSVTETRQLNLLAGNNNCTCVNIECNHFAVAISQPDVRLPDLLCPIHIESNDESCYNADKCNRFSRTPFFRICESQNLPTSSSCNHIMCFGNITADLSGTKLDFYILNKTVCNSDSGTLYLARVYQQSFELIGR